MKAFLMHPDRDFDIEQEPPANAADLTQDLELDVLLDAMGGGDPFVREVARRAVLLSLTEPETIVHRQQVLADCLAQPAVIREIYDLAVAAIEGERRGFYFFFKDSPDSIVTRSVQVLEFFAQMLARLRAVADEHANAFGSPGFTRFFRMLAEELRDDYLKAIDEHLKELRFRRGILVSAQLGSGNKGSRYVLRRMQNPSWTSRLPVGNRSSYSFLIPERDQSGYRALSELRGRGLNAVANALAQSTDHILNFFRLLRIELAFYVGCLNLHERLAAKGEPTGVPVPVPAGTPAFTTSGLYDVCLSLTVDQRVVGNDVVADGKRLVMITGANQGGKSTFLRSAGQACLMMQAGMFVPAESFRANVAPGVFTHYKREEDATMERGKLDEELARMRDIVDQIRPHGLLLCNESFASTNEREGSQIARQVIRAFIDAEVKIFFVTHLFDLAHGFHRDGNDGTLFLRAERRADGRRTYKLRPGEPLPTSYGEDLYRRIFREDMRAQAAVRS